MQQIKVSLKVLLLALLPQLEVYKINKYTKYISKRKNYFHITFCSNLIYKYNKILMVRNSCVLGSNF